MSKPRLVEGHQGVAQVPIGANGNKDEHKDGYERKEEQPRLLKNAQRVVAEKRDVDIVDQCHQPHQVGYDCQQDAGRRVVVPVGDQRQLDAVKDEQDWEKCTGMVI